MLVKTTPVPPRGWNSYDSYGVYINEEQAIANIDAFAEKLAPHGYEYFVLDACWYSDGTFMDTYRLRKEGKDRRSHIDHWGRFIESPELFPHGLRALADRCHSKGFKFGVHLMRGLPALALEYNTPVKGAPGVFARDIADYGRPCAWEAPYMGSGIDMTKPGAQEYYDSVVEYLAEIAHVDFIKFDDVLEYHDEIEALAKAIEKVERPIILSISPGQQALPRNWDFLKKYANMVRITCDIWDGDAAHWSEKFMRMEAFEKVGSPECWADLDMIPIGGIQAHVPEDTDPEYYPVWGCRRKSYNSDMENRILMTQIALMKSPLFYGGDLVMSDEKDIAFVTDPEMLDCNVNGVGCECIFRQRHADVRRSEKQGDPAHGWLGVFNRSCLNELTFVLTAEELGFYDRELPVFRDIWEKREVRGENGALTLTIPPNGCVFLSY